MLVIIIMFLNAKTYRSFAGVPLKEHPTGGTGEAVEVPADGKVATDAADSFWAAFHFGFDEC